MNLTPNPQNQRQTWLTPLNLHFAAIGLLLAVCVFLAVRLALATQAAKADNSSAISTQTAQMKAAELAALPLRGLDNKIAKAKTDADLFYQQRLPYNYSTVVAELGALAKRQNVKLTRVQYTQGPTVDDPTSGLTEVKMDASLSGDYRPLAQFINSLERDHIFFLINSIALSGQQSGTVGLRVRMTTYLRIPTDADTPAKGDQP